MLGVERKFVAGFKIFVENTVCYVILPYSPPPSLMFKISVVFSIKMPNQIAILDAGSQFGKLIDRRLHELGIKCDLLPLSFGGLIDELKLYIKI